jgi:hypothetical protein
MDKEIKNIYNEKWIFLIIKEETKISFFFKEANLLIIIELFSLFLCLQNNL